MPPASPPRSPGLAEASGDIVEWEPCAWVDGVGVDAIGPDEHATAPSSARASGHFTMCATSEGQPSYVTNPLPRPAIPSRGGCTRPLLPRFADAVTTVLGMCGRSLDPS